MFAVCGARTKPSAEGRRVPGPLPAHTPRPHAHHVRVPFQCGVPAQVSGPAAVQADERSAAVMAGELAVCREGWP